MDSNENNPADKDVLLIEDGEIDVVIRNKRKRNIILATIALIILIFAALALWFLYEIGFFKSKGFSPKDEKFNYSILKSDIDYNDNDVDDFADILSGAKTQAKKKPKYKIEYYEDGYPPENEGVCTDLVWRALENAGYSLKALVDNDIAKNIDKYPRVNGKPDPNIDFRRVKNLKVYFDRHTTSLTTDLNQKSEWQPGDIVVFGESHIAIVSDIRNEEGIPFLIHSYSRFQLYFEEDAMERFNAKDKISGHYRWILR